MLTVQPVYRHTEMIPHAASSPAISGIGRNLYTTYITGTERSIITLEGTQNTKQPKNEWHLTSDRPVFIQIMEKLKLDIVTGVYSPGDKLPSVRDLAGEAAVNPNTMQRAFSELEREGLVYTQRTNGRFITEDIAMINRLKEQMALDAISQFLKSMRQLGISGEETLKLLEESLKEEKK